MPSIITIKTSVISHNSVLQRGECKVDPNVKLRVRQVCVIEYEARIITTQNRICEVAVADPVAAGRFSENTV